MAYTTSLAFPNMIDASRGIVTTYEDDKAITSRTRLLLLTEPTELYNEPNFGTGLKKFLWQYNTPNTTGMIKDLIRQKIKQYEPSVDAENSIIVDGLISEQSDIERIDPNSVKLTVGMRTNYGKDLSVDVE